MSNAVGPLSQAAIQRIDATLLPQLDRHHLRLLAHCLACFQAMQPASLDGALPEESARKTWCLAQPLIAADPGFLLQMLEQLDVAALQLENIAVEQGVRPMALSLEHLIKAVESRCRSHVLSDCDHQQTRDTVDDA